MNHAAKVAVNNEEIRKILFINKSNRKGINQ